MNKEHRKISASQGLGITGMVKVITYKAGTKEILRETGYEKNLIMLGVNTGKSLILGTLGAFILGLPYTGQINYGAMGISSVTPTIADTILGNEQARAQLSLASISSNVLTLQFFYADAATPSNTYTEFGTFVDGSVTLNTGQIFNHILFGTPYIKSSGEDTTVQLLLTIN